MRIKIAAFSLLALLNAARCFADPSDQVGNAGGWENISDVLFKDVVPANAPADKPKGPTHQSQGMWVEPGTGQVLLNYSPWVKPVLETGLYRSKDQGATWETVAHFPLSGRGETGFSFNVSYPYSGRIFLFTIDGLSGSSADGGASWKPLGKHNRGFDFGDVDWSVPNPQTMFALEHEPWFKCLSTDGGATWTRIDEAADAANKPGQNVRLGVVNASTLLLGDGRRDGIHLSTDLGKTWEKVADFRPLGSRPVHYGKKLYWATAAGIVVSENGRDWSLAGAALPNATCGPYFGKTEADMMAVTDKGFFITRDGAKSWTNAAPFIRAPGIAGYERNANSQMFGWDADRNILYAERSSGSCYRLKLK